MTTICHFTHEANLEAILAEGALLCDNLCQAKGCTTRDIAYSSLKAQRARTAVEVPPGRTLDYYVPFYFGPRSPMLYAYKGGYVTGKAESQDEIIYFATTAERIVESGALFAFSDGHPIREPKAFYNDLSQIEQVDLNVMKAKMWNDTDQDPDRKRRRQAEFLVWERVPISLIAGLVTKTEAKREEVDEIVAKYAAQIRCYVRPNWYYD